MKLSLTSWLLIYTLSATQPTLVEKPQLFGECCTTLLSEVIPQPGLSNDFESKTLQPWFDVSEDGSFWTIGSFSAKEMNTKSNFLSPPPTKDGNYFIYLKNYFNLFGVGILQTESFVALPGDQLGFSYWIYSALSELNNIQVFWSETNQKEDKRLIELFSFSFSTNQEWNSLAVAIPIKDKTEGKIIIYGFFTPENDAQGMIAIDNIVFLRNSFTIPNMNGTATTDLTSWTGNTENEDKSTPNSIQTTEIVSKSFGSSDSLVTLKTSEVSLPPESTEVSVYPSICNPADFLPCTCQVYNGVEPDVTCDNIAIADARDGIFSKLYQRYIGFLKILPADGEKVSANLFGTSLKECNYFTLDCIYMANPIEIDIEAFETEDPIKFTYFYLYNCKFLNLNFLSGVENVYVLKFLNSADLHESFQTIPIGFHFDVLTIRDSNLTAFTNPDQFPIISGGIQEFTLMRNVIENEVLLFMGWLLENSGDTLEKLYPMNCGLSKFPALPLWRFNALSNFRFDENILKTGVLEKNSLSFSSPAFYVSLNGCGVQVIEPGAFKGNYMRSNLFLENNNLTSFEEFVFLPLLEQMISEGIIYRGYVNVANNPFDCATNPCHLTWLLRDRRNLLKLVKNATCENGRPFWKIPANDTMFNGCP